MALITDKITRTRNGARPNSARVTTARSAGGTSLTCDSLAGWPTSASSPSTAVKFVTYKIDTNNNPIAGTQLDCKGIVSGSSIGSFTVVDGTDNGHAIGDVVEMLPTADWGDDLAQHILTSHNQDGTIKSGLTYPTPTFTGTMTFPAGGIPTAAHANTSITADKLSTGALGSFVATNEGTSSTTYADLSTTTDTVTLTIGANGLALVNLTATFFNSGSNDSFVSFAVSGATTLSATDNTCIRQATTSALGLGAPFLVTGLAPGSTTFKMKYRVSAGTGSFLLRRISVVPL